MFSKIKPLGPVGVFEYVPLNLRSRCARGAVGIDIGAEIGMGAGVGADTGGVSMGAGVGVDAVNEVVRGDAEGWRGVEGTGVSSLASVLPSSCEGVFEIVPLATTGPVGRMGPAGRMESPFADTIFICCSFTSRISRSLLSRRSQSNSRFSR